MLPEEKIIDLILDFGLSLEEIKILLPTRAISYIRHHHKKKDGKSSILFRGFSKEETMRLEEISIFNTLSVKSNLTVDLTFLCSIKQTGLKYIDDAKLNGTKILSREEFEIIFSKNHTNYDLIDIELIYDSSIQDQFRIARPLSNFNEDIKEKSWALDNNKVYDLNLFKMTCSCPDFIEGRRSRFKEGDVRRLCKHLMRHYKNNFGLYKLSEFMSQAFENYYPVKTHLEKVNLESYGFEILANYDDNLSWWAVHVKDKNGKYTRYGYNPVEKQFGYFEKPYGIVTPLKIRLKEIQKRLNVNNSKVQIRKSKDEENQILNSEHGGCILLLIIIFIALIISWIFS